MMKDEEWKPEVIEAAAQVQAALELLRDLDPDVANGNHILPPPVRERCLALIAERNPRLAAKIRAGDDIPPERRFTYRALAELKQKLIRSGALRDLSAHAAWGVDMERPGGRALLELMLIANDLL